MINLFQPTVGAEEWSAVAAVLRSNWLGAGEQVARFKEEFANYVGCAPDQFVTTTSCTEALFHAFAALGLGPGDEVVMPSIHFVGAAHAVAETGARIILCDVDPRTLNPRVEHVQPLLTRRTAACLLLHYGGTAGDVPALAELATNRGFALIEDAAIGLGSFVEGRAAGTFGAMGLWSFDTAKTITAGDGGMIWCPDARTRERITQSIALGGALSGFPRAVATCRWWEIDPATTGRWAVMNDIAAAIGREQLRRLPEYLARRAEIAAAYDARLQRLGWLSLPPPMPPGAVRTFYWIQTTPAIRDELARHLLDRGVYTSFKYWPLHRMRLYASDQPLPGADQAADRTLLLPVHQGLSNADVDFIASTVEAFRS